MILVVGATGILGSEVCTSLRRQGAPVRALARQTANPERLDALRSARIEIAWGDLKHSATLRGACDGVRAVISTASSTLSRQQGDSIEAVDRQGQLNLISAARAAGVDHFTFISIPRRLSESSPLSRAKDEAERALIDSGIPYTILAANYFMEVWLSPALGFDYPNQKAVIFGDGTARISWISYHDVADFAVLAHQTPAARNRILEVGGPDDLSPLEVVGIFERTAGASFDRQFVPEQNLVAQAQSATDPLAETFAKLQLEVARGCISNSAETLPMIPHALTSVEQYAASSLARRAVVQ